MTLQLPEFGSAKVFIVGDLMLDRYWQGSTSRISPEAPVPVVNVNDIEERLGGAGNVALNLAMLGVQTDLFSICGDDEAATTLQRELKAAKITAHLIKDANIPTVTKLRIISLQQQLIRLDFEEKMPVLNTQALHQRCIGQLSQANALILSDYGKGSLQDPQPLIQAAKQAGVPVLVDPKGKDFSIYRGASLITPNLKEFQAVVGECHNEKIMIEKGHVLLKEHDLGALLITRGQHGMTLLRRDKEARHLPTRAREVYDVTGAGDTVIAMFAAAIAAGKPFEEAMALSNIAAGIVVGKLGTATASIAELKRRLHYPHHAGVMDEHELIADVKKAQEKGEKIVMTNGCFDILHPGHIAYLEEARARGDRLIVAVNTDASVKRLKGPARPVNPTEHRMAVLAGLASVDWVVPFTEDTPERLVSQVLPDVLVKGGDWKVEEIAGSKHVIEKGGRVESLSFYDGFSTTSVIDKIQEAEKQSVLEEV